MKIPNAQKMKEENQRQGNRCWKWTVQKEYITNIQPSVNCSADWGPNIKLIFSPYKKEPKTVLSIAKYREHSVYVLSRCENVLSLESKF